MNVLKIKPTKILVISTRRLGDALLATPITTSLRQAYPETRIHFLTYNGNRSILEGNTDIEKIITLSEQASFSEQFRLIRQIRRQYDLAISTMIGDKPILYALFAAKQRISLVPPLRWQDRWKRWICSHWVEQNERQHIVLRNLSLINVMGLHREAKITVPRTASPSTIGKPITKPYAVIHPYPKFRYKEWSFNNWLKVIYHLSQNKGLTVLLSGGPDEQEQLYIRKLHDASATMSINIAGTVSLAQLAEVIAEASIYIGPDTSVTHLAAATGTPTIALFGPTETLLWGPWPSGWPLKNPYQSTGSQLRGNVALIQGPGHCVPCHKEGCEQHLLSYSACLDKLPIDQVTRTIDSMLRKQANDTLLATTSAED